jgi:hypothetical protein
MSLLERLERIFGRFAIPNLSLYLVIGQVFVLLTRMLGLIDGERLIFAPIAFPAGEGWRVLTFLFVTPMPTSAFGYVGAVFGWYLFYLMGSALEQYWGAFRFNAFFFMSYALTVALSFITPQYQVSNLYILGSVFLAFAYLNPDFQLLLFFVLPVKIKWLALLTWGLCAFNFAVGRLSLRLQIAAATITFLTFFGRDMLRRRGQARRSSEFRAAHEAEKAEPRHVCHVCGRTDLTNPELDFRYCSKCAGDQCYCPDHIHNHSHVVAPEEAGT